MLLTSVNTIDILQEYFFTYTFGEKNIAKPLLEKLNEFYFLLQREDVIYI